VTGARRTRLLIYKYSKKKRKAKGILLPRSETLRDKIELFYVCDFYNLQLGGLIEARENRPSGEKTTEEISRLHRCSADSAVARRHCRLEDY
jgi:hypothetical protein